MGLSENAGYAALLHRAAWIDFSARARIAVVGSDAERLLHSLTTNHIRQLAPGGGCYAFFLDAQGHILADAYVLRQEGGFLLDAEPELRGKLMEHLDRYIIADDVTVEDATEAWGLVWLEGPKCESILAELGAPRVEAFCAHAAWEGGRVARLDLLGGPGYAFYVAAERKPEVIRRLEAAGAVAASVEDANVVRIERGKPRYGVDITERNLVQETQALHAVHFSKGCYLGQEIVERVRSRGTVKRRLARLEIETEDPPAPGTPCGTGIITSAAFSGARGKVVALAYVAAEEGEPGRMLSVAGAPARVLPPYQPPA
jgi:folate-binding protein YgfZ